MPADFQRVSVITAWFCAILTSRESHFCTQWKVLFICCSISRKYCVYPSKKKSGQHAKLYSNKWTVCCVKKENVFFATSISVFAQMHNCSDARAICWVLCIIRILFTYVFTPTALDDSSSLITLHFRTQLSRVSELMKTFCTEKQQQNVRTRKMYKQQSY